ncbi:hypothetical protein CTAYLR_008146 [Chrysophaeum taylorii]|uniref:Peptidase S1 domain-containing protein n=1 Tax=Chrysophaeum taylorii TaxID=2483200 RepID=A0AAD7XN34_9STRA|nr:hypothetical protein CTAYLR_008146 [Chrysophaeum taylorii]
MLVVKVLGAATVCAVGAQGALNRTRHPRLPGHRDGSPRRVAGAKRVGKGEHSVRLAKFEATKTVSRVANETRFESFTSKVKRAKPAQGELLRDRRLEECGSFDDDPHDPTESVQVYNIPWARAEVCKLVITYEDGSQALCSGTLVGPYHLLTSRHCGQSACVGLAISMQIACGFGYDADVFAADLFDFAHLGTAYVVDLATNCYSMEEYTDTCIDNVSYLTQERGYDIQLCKVDRELGQNLGWFEMSDEDVTNAGLNIMGYPGYLEALEEYIPYAFLSRLLRYSFVTNLIEREIRFDGAYAWPGESGGPYYRFTASTDERAVVGIHGGGPTGCYEEGARVTTRWVEVLAALKGEESLYTDTMAAWTNPDPYCQIIQYQADVFGLYDASPILGIAYNPTTGEYDATVTLFNVGTKETTMVVAFYLSEDDIVVTEDVYLDETTIDMPAYTVYRLKVSINLGGSAGFVGAVWTTPDCYTNDGTTALIGFAG